ncbi:MAG: type IV secretion system DNA-binding domain-containing protein [Verrucomicrobiota bacterium]
MLTELIDVVGLVTIVTGVGLTSRAYKNRPPVKKVLRGNSLTLAEQMTPDENRPYLFGSMYLSFDDLRKHTVVVGSSGAGKTVQIILLMKTICKRMVEKGTGVKALLYDSKTDLLSQIRGMGVPEEQILILNALDRRCHAWEICKDIRTQPEAEDVAKVLIPEIIGSDKDPYFRLTAQGFLSAIIEVLQERTPDDWDIRDLILATKSKARLEAFLLAGEDTDDLIEEFEPERTFKNVFSTLRGNLKQFRSVAASWHLAREAGRSFGISDWLNSQSMLVLGNDPKAKAPIRILNQLLFTEVSKNILAQPGTLNDEKFIILDEFRELGKLDSMGDLMITGRSKGAAIILGFQDILGVDAAYGHDESREIIGNASNLGILHINSTAPDTQEWASKVLGDHEFMRKETSISHSNSSSSSMQGGSSGSSISTNTNYRQMMEKVWFPSLFATELPPTNPENGQRGLFRVNNHFFRSNILGEHLFFGDGPHGLPKPVDDFPNLVRRERDEFKLKPWTDEDFERLGIPGLKEACARSPRRKPEGERTIEEPTQEHQDEEYADLD